MGNRQAILIVEDDPLNRKLLTVLLEREGYVVTVVSTGEDALAALGATRPDLLILDVNLPGIGGWEVAVRWRAGERHGRLPILAMSGTAGPEAATRSIEAGCDAFVGKPVDVRTFSQVVARCLASAR